MTIVSDRVEHEIHIKAPPETVFAYFTDPQRHPRWMGVEATLDPRPGGVYRCVVHDKATVLGEYVLVEPPHKVVFTWGFEGNEDVPPSSSTVTVTLTADGSGTLLRLVHTGLPHPSLGSHDRGWTTYLHNLSDAE